MVVAGGDYVHQLIAIFVRHQAEIEHLALAKLQREGHSARGVVVTTEDMQAGCSTPSLAQATTWPLAVVRR